MLEAQGYAVIAVSTPAAALALEVSRFHLAVVDYDMPGLNGFELLLRLRAAHATCPIVLLSGSARDLSQEKRIVFTQCLEKGAPIQELLSAVKFHLTSSPDPPECQAIAQSQSLYRRHGL